MSGGRSGVAPNHGAADGRHGPGKWVGAALFTEDVKTAVRFYGEAFGWSFQAFPAARGPGYTLAVSDGEPVGGLLQRGMLILLVCAGVSSVFRSGTVTFLLPLINNALGAGFNVIGWVMLRRPVETYFVRPVPIRTSSAVHRFLKSLQIEIPPESHAATVG